ncbi:MAG: beta-lactamase regulating signal transducer with metallopeptidase domain [Verrucomicrobiales bacterium]|jgi:beta-lactamase regulating signal transducer with metallopeptidase domain
MIDAWIHWWQSHSLALVAFHGAFTLIIFAVLWSKVNLGTRLMLGRYFVIAMLLAPCLFWCYSRIPSQGLPQMTSGAELIGTDEVTVLPEVATSGVSFPPQVSRFNWHRILLALWALGVALALYRLGKDVKRTRRHLGQLSPMPGPDAAEVRRLLFLHEDDEKPLRLLVDANSRSPYSIRARERILVMPRESLTVWSPDAFGCILRHEWAHLRHFDSLDTFLWALVRACFWWNPFLKHFSARINEVQEWRADAEAVGTEKRLAVKLSRILLDCSDLDNPILCVNSVSSGKASQLKRRMCRLLQIEDAHSRANAPGRLGKVIAIMVASGTLLASAQLAPKQQSKSAIDEDLVLHLQENEEQLKKRERAMEELITQVKGVDTNDFVAVEVKFFEFNGGDEGHKVAPETTILSPNQAKQLAQKLPKDRTTTQVSYPRVLTKNRRLVEIRSIINEPVLASTDPETNTSTVQYLPIGTVIDILPVILENDVIHCEVKLSVSSIIGERIISGNVYPIASSRLYHAPLKVTSGHTVRIDGLNESVSGRAVTKDKCLTVLITPTRLTSEQAKQESQE